MEHSEYMLAALDAARLGPEGDPNPRVGCVLVTDDGTIIATGHHRGAGTPHAEVAALMQAGDTARGTTAYVTLEPCNHTGRTGPCAQALLDAGVRRVFYAVPDPTAEASGGAGWLAARGVEVASGTLAAEAVAVNATWFHRALTGRPWVTWKYAATLDGRSAAADGTSQWITGPAARADVHHERARCGAVAVGTGTALADNPHLTTRDTEGILLPRQPLRVVVGRRPIPADARVLDAAAETLLLKTHDVADVLDALAARGVHHLWLEGGPHLAAAFWQAGAVDEVIAYVAPTLLGSGTAAVADLGVTTLSQRHDLVLTDVRLIGGDLKITALPRKDS